MTTETLVSNIECCVKTLENKPVFSSVIFNKDYKELDEYKLDNLKLFIKTL